MKGLLYKDFLLTWKNCKFHMIMALIYIVITAMGYYNTSTTVLFGVLACMMISNAALTLITVDERDKWPVYSDALPVSRGMYVSSKYLLTFTMQLVVVALSALSLLVAKDVSFALGMLSIVWTMSFLMPALMLPLAFWLGPDKGRIAYAVVAGLTAAVTTGLLVIFQSGEVNFSGDMTSTAMPLTAGLVDMALFALSWPISIKLYARRKF